MPGPVVYVVAALGTIAAIIAFKEFVYEPHIAPKVEVWAESFLENRRERRRQRQGLVANAPHPETEDGDENEARRSSDGLLDKKRKDGIEDMSLELEELVSREVNEWRDSVHQSNSSLRHRRTAGVMDENNTFIPYPSIPPTHVIADSPTSSSPTTPLNEWSRTSSPQLAMRSLSPPIIVMQDPHRPPGLDRITVPSPRPLTPLSLSSGPSSRATTPSVIDMSSEHSFHSRRASLRSSTLSRTSTLSFPPSRASTPDSIEVRVPPSMYSTALMSTDHNAPAALPVSPHNMTEDPFSEALADAYSDRSDSPITLVMPSIHFENISNGSSHDGDDVMSLGSDSPDLESVDGDLLDAVSQHGSDDSSWASVGRRTPEL